MKSFKTLPFNIVLTFTMIFSALPAAVNAAEGGEAGGLMPMQGGLAAHSVSADSLPENKPAMEDRGLNDHLARIFEFQGDVTVLKKGSEEWQKASKGMLLEEGDKIVTGAASHVDIAYDHFFLNIVRIQEKTKGEFRSIEPTQLFLEDGTIFSALDGLGGESYQISTPTAVAGVRGTTFDVSYEAQSGNMQTHVFPDQSSHLGEIALKSEDGQEFKIVEGQGFSDGMVGGIPEGKMEEAKQFMRVMETQFSDSRQEGLLMLNEMTEKKSEKEPMEDRLMERDENKKIGGGPNDGGDTDGSGLNRTEAGELPGSLKMDGDVDALVDDAMTPPSGIAFSGPETGSDPAVKRLDTADRGDGKEPKSFADPGARENKTQPDYDKAVEFLGVGGVHAEKGKESTVVTEFFDSTGTRQFVEDPNHRDGAIPGTQPSGSNRPAFEKEPASSFRDGFQPPPFDPNQFFQPGSTGSGSTTIVSDPNFRPEIKDQIITTNNDNPLGGSTDSSKDQGIITST